MVQWSNWTAQKKLCDAQHHGNNFLQIKTSKMEKWMSAFEKSFWIKGGGRRICHVPLNFVISAR